MTREDFSEGTELEGIGHVRPITGRDLVGCGADSQARPERGAEGLSPESGPAARASRARATASFTFSPGR